MTCDLLCPPSNDTLHRTEEKISFLGRGSCPPCTQKIGIKFTGNESHWKEQRPFSSPATFCFLILFLTVPQAQCWKQDSIKYGREEMKQCPILLVTMSMGYYCYSAGVPGMLSSHVTSPLNAHSTLVEKHLI